MGVSAEKLELTEDVDNDREVLRLWSEVPSVFVKGRLKGN